MKPIILILQCLCLFVLLAGSAHGQKADTLSLIADRGFAGGVLLKGTNSVNVATGKSLYPFKKQSGAPLWSLAEWESKYPLSQDRLKQTEGVSIYRDRGKMISFQRLEKDCLVRMEVEASAEYSAPRKPGQGWPHLLLEQSFPEKVRFAELKNLWLEFSGRLVAGEMKMKAEEFNQGLHAAQFQLFLVVQDLNPNSAGYRDYLWFGVPFYDYRFRESEVYAAKDVGKDDATGKFIYSLASRDFMNGSFHDREWKTIHKDLYPEIRKALTLARARGYLTQSADADLAISGMNIGWEVPGTFDVSFEFKGFDIRAVR